MKLADYIKGVRRGREAHDIELDAMRDQLLGEGLEGFDAVPGDHLAAMERLAGRIERSAAAGRVASRARARRLREGRIRGWSIAAAAVFLIGVVGGGILFFKDGIPTDASRGTLAQETNTATNGAGRSDWNEVAILPPVEVAEEKIRDSIAQAQRQERLRKERERQREEAILAARSITVVPDEPAAEIEATDFSELTPAEGEIPGLAADRLAMRVADEIPADTAPQAQKQAQAGAGTGAGANMIATRSLGGRVVDASTGEALPGAFVHSEAADTGVIADADGRFVLPASEGAKIVAHYLGYESAEVRADSTGNMLVAMVPDQNSLDEVVVVGFGVRKKANIVRSIIRVRGSRSEEKSSASDPVPSPADTVVTAEFKRFVAGRGASEVGWATVSFEVGADGRPRNITVVESSSSAAVRTARRLLRHGPDWPTQPASKLITINFEMKNEK